MKICPNMGNITPMDMELVTKKIATVFDVSSIVIKSRSSYFDKETIQNELTEVTQLISEHVTVRMISQSLFAWETRKKAWDVQLLLHEETLELQIILNTRMETKEKFQKCKKICKLLSEFSSIRLAAEVYYRALIVSGEEERKQAIRSWKGFDKELVALSHKQETA